MAAERWGWCEPREGRAALPGRELRWVLHGIGRLGSGGSEDGLRQASDWYL